MCVCVYKCAREGQRGGGRGNPKQVPRCQHRARGGAQTHQPGDHDLSPEIKSQMLNTHAHTHTHNTDARTSKLVHSQGPAAQGTLTEGVDVLLGEDRHGPSLRRDFTMPPCQPVNGVVRRRLLEDACVDAGVRAGQGAGVGVLGVERTACKPVQLDPSPLRVY